MQMQNKYNIGCRNMREHLFQNVLNTLKQPVQQIGMQPNQQQTNTFGFQGNQMGQAPMNNTGFGL